MKPVNGRTVLTSTDKKGTYHAKSEMKFFNGNGYNNYTTYATPNVQNSLIQMPSNIAYEVNESGLTYGTDYYVESPEESPDLIRVIGKNGVEGYVYSKDFNLELNNLDEVIDYINLGQFEYTVPVYAVDGIEKIDTFEISPED